MQLAAQDPAAIPAALKPTILRAGTTAACAAMLATATPAMSLLLAVTTFDTDAQAPNTGDAACFAVP